MHNPLTFYWWRFSGKPAKFSTFEIRKRFPECPISPPRTQFSVPPSIKITGNQFTRQIPQFSFEDVAISRSNSLKFLNFERIFLLGVGFRFSLMIGCCCLVFVLAASSSGRGMVSGFLSRTRGSSCMNEASGFINWPHFYVIASVSPGTPTRWLSCAYAMQFDDNCCIVRQKSWSMASLEV